jgi:hypothetical protein
MRIIILLGLLLAGCLDAQLTPRAEGRGLTAELAPVNPPVKTLPPVHYQSCGLSLPPLCFRGETPVCVRNGLMPEWACGVDNVDNE